MLKQKTEDIKINVNEKMGVYPQTARIAGTGDSGEIMVEFNGKDPIPARILSSLDRDELSRRESKGTEVLLVFEGGDPERPIIVGQIETLLDDIVSMEVNKQNTKDQVETVVDGKRIVFEAEKEIVLKCGKGSITISKDGKIIVKGTNLLSRSSGTNRIKGGSVSIN